MFGGPGFEFRCQGLNFRVMGLHWGLGFVVVSVWRLTKFMGAFEDFFMPAKQYHPCDKNLKRGASILQNLYIAGATGRTLRDCSSSSIPNRPLSMAISKTDFSSHRLLS